MSLRFSRTAAAVLCALGAHAGHAAEPTDLLQTISVESEVLTPAMTPINPQKLSAGRESAEALRDLLGVSGSRMGGHGTDVSIRGQSQTRLNILLDGAYVHGGCPNRMDPPTAYANTGNYEEVTVIRGVQTLEYGGGGTGGTVLFERVTERFEEDEGARGELEAGYRGNGSISDLGVDAAAGGEQGFARLIASYTDAHNYEDGDGNVVRSAYTESGQTLILGYTPTAQTRAELSLEQQRTDDQLFPGAGMDSQYADNDTWRIKLNSSEVGGSLARVAFELYDSQVKHSMDNYTLRPNAGTRMRAPSTSDTLGGRLVATLDSELGRWKLGIDTQRNQRDADRFNDTLAALNSVLWPGVEIDQTGAFAELTHDFGGGNRVTGGLRYDYVRSRATRADVDPPGGPLSPNALYALYYGGARATTDEQGQVGGLLRFEHDLVGDGGTLYASLSRSVRTPDATERYIASNAGAPSDRWVGNPQIRPEQHHQVEIGAVLRGSAWDADLSMFYNDVSDYILRDRFSQAGNNATIYRNVAATLAGGEARLGYRFAPGWRGEVGLAYVYAQNDTDDRAIAQTPPLEALAGLEYTTDRLTAGGRVRAAATQNRVDTTSSTGIAGQGLDVRETPGWAVLDLYARYDVGESFSIDVGVDNLFDHYYAQHLNRSNAFDPTQVQVNEPGRSAWVKLSARF